VFRESGTAAVVRRAAPGMAALALAALVLALLAAARLRRYPVN
jgi:hypothetical protein